MATEERIRHLLRVADRAEGEGDRRAARLFRRMAQDALPVADTEQKGIGGALREFDF
jgi:hypothetical protein